MVNLLKVWIIMTIYSAYTRTPSLNAESYINAAAILDVANEAIW